MKKTKILFGSLVLVGTMIYTSCQKKPTACISASATTVVTNQKIDFTSCSTDGSGYAWDFGDGQTSAEQNPSHSYSSAKTYDVTLTTSSKNGKKSDKSSVSITVTATPISVTQAMLNSSTNALVLNATGNT